MQDQPAWQRWGDGELAYSPRRGRHAIKVGLASTIALVFAVRYDWGHPSWVLMMILPSMLPILGAAIQIVMIRLTAVLLGGVFSLVVVAKLKPVKRTLPPLTRKAAVGRMQALERVPQMFRI